MNTTELLNKIQAAGKAQVDTEEAKRAKEIQLVESMERRVMKLIPRIKDMYDLMNCLAENAIFNHKFTTNGIGHNVGFFTMDRNTLFGMDKKGLVCKPLLKFGVEGGGCCGRDLIIDLQEETITYKGERYSYYHKYYLKEVLTNIDDFEDRLKKYIESL